MHRQGSMLFAARIVLAYLVLIPWTVMFIPDLSGHDYARIAEILICTACGLSIIWRLWSAATEWHDTGIHAPAKKWQLWLAAVASLALISVARAPVIKNATQELILMLGLVAVAITVATADREPRPVSYLRVILVACLFYNSIAMVVLSAGMLSGDAVDIENLGMGYDNRRFFNHVQTVALPLIATALHCQNLSRRWRAAAWVGLVSGFALLFLSGGRGTFVGIVGATLLAATLMSPSSRWHCIRPLAIGMLAGLFVYMLLFVQVPNWLELPQGVGLSERARDGGSVSARFYLWRLGLDFASESPWLGIGPMHFAHRIHPDAAHPHNIYIQIAAEWGVPMLIVLLLGAGTALLQFARSGRATTDVRDACMGGSLLIACTAALLDGVFSGNFVMPVSQMWIAVCAGMSAQWVFRHTPPRTVPYSAAGVPLVRAGAGMLVVAFVLQAALLLHDVRSLDKILAKAEYLSVNDYYNPRFWSNGWF
jgi:O-antigen ligase